jgi:hypothetical protein
LASHSSCADYKDVANVVDLHFQSLLLEGISMICSLTRPLFAYVKATPDI